MFKISYMNEQAIFLKYRISLKNDQNDDSVEYYVLFMRIGGY